MKPTLQPKAVRQYADSFARHVCEPFFAGSDAVSGKDIVAFTDIPQVNYAVLSNLFNNWQQETARLKSPYFDYTPEEVKTALEQLMNALSRHIRVERPAFEDLLAKGASTTLMLLLDPRRGFAEMLETLDFQPITLRRLREQTRYIRLNRPVWDGLLDKLSFGSPAETDAIPLDRALAALDDLLDNAGTLPEDAESHLALFSAHVPLPDLYQPEPEPQPEPVATPAPQTGGSFFDSLPDTVHPPAVQVPAPPPPADKPPVSSPSLPPVQAAPPPHLQPGEVKVDIEEFARAANNKPLVSLLSEKKKAGETTLNDTLNRDKTTLNEKLRKEDSTFIEMAQNNRINHIKDALNLNLKYYFVNNLFGGDNVAFAQAIHELEQAPDFSSAVRLLEVKYAHTLGWDLQSEEFQAFTDVIERKFV